MLEKTIPYIWMAVARDCASEVLASLRSVSYCDPWMSRWEQDLASFIGGVVELTPADSLRFIVVDAPAYAREINVSLASGDATVMRKTIEAPRWIRTLWTYVRSFVLNPTCGIRRLAINHRQSRRTADRDCYEYFHWSRKFVVTCVYALRQVLGLYARLTYESSDGPSSAIPFPASTKPCLINTAMVRRDGNKVTLSRCQKQRATQLWIGRGKRIPLLYRELSLPYAGKTDEETLNAFKERVTQCPTLPSGWHWLGLSSTFWRGFTLDLSQWENDLEPKHGPGAVAERLTAPEKEAAMAWNDPQYSQLAETLTRPLFPDSTSPGWETNSPQNYTDVDRATWLAAKRPHQNAAPAHSSRVCLVPKDYRGKRVIAAEPCLHQYIQQGVMKKLVAFLRRSCLQEVIHLHSQDFNRDAARAGSIYGSLDTIDLSDASDTVRISHLALLLEGRPEILDQFNWLRTRSVSIREGEDVELTTAFPMGSALCFPVESLVFSFCLITEALRLPEFRRLPMNGRSVRTVVERLHLLVYGDDIILSHAYSAWAIDTLERWGFKPNRAKCCTAPTCFRESCGADCLFGIDVTPVRPRSLPGSSEVTLDGLIACVEEFSRKGLLHGALAILDVAQRAFDCSIPVVPSDERCAGCVSSDLLYYYADKTVSTKYDRGLQSTYFHVWLGKPRMIGVGTARHLREALVGHALDPLDPTPVFQGWPDGDRLEYTKHRVLASGRKAVEWTDLRIAEFLDFGMERLL